MDVRKYKKYLAEVEEVFGLNNAEVTGLFLSAVARAYGSLGSAYVWEDGTISLISTSSKIGDSSLVIKDYVVSAKQYAEIVKIFTELVDAYSKERDELFFIQKVKGKSIKVVVAKVERDYYLLKPIFDFGGIRNYKLILKKTKMFANENLSSGDEIYVVCKGLNKIGKFIDCHRFDKKICDAIFKEEFNKLIRDLDEEYCYKNFKVVLNYKEKKISFFVEWKILANGFFISALNKRLNKRLGKCRIMLKEKNPKKEQN